jgi:hypothetical protein
MTKDNDTPTLDKPAWIKEADAFWDEATDRSKAGAKLLADRAGIPELYKNRFIEKVVHYLRHAQLQKKYSIAGFSDAERNSVLEVEVALRKALKIILGFPQPHIFFHVDRPTKPLSAEERARKDVTWENVLSQKVVIWKDVLTTMVAHLADFTGKSPRVVAGPKKRGRSKGARTQHSYQLRRLIWNLALAVEEGHGELTLYRENKSGTWIDALNDLRPLMPGIIPNANEGLLSMIEVLGNRARKHLQHNSRFSRKPHGIIRI